MVARTRPTVTIIRTSRVILNLDVATVRSVAFSKARLAQLQACLIMCLATGGKRCGVYCVATDRKCITLPEILPVVSPLCTVWCFTFVPLRRVVDAHSKVLAHFSTCISPSILETCPHWLKIPLPRKKLWFVQLPQIFPMTGTVVRNHCSPQLNQIQFPEMQPIISPRNWAKTF